MCHAGEGGEKVNKKQWGKRVRSGHVSPNVGVVKVSSDNSAQAKQLLTKPIRFLSFIRLLRWLG